MKRRPFMFLDSTSQFTELLSPAGLANIFNTIPFGFGLGFLFSLSLEALQFLNMVITQISQRTVSINDLINNELASSYFFYLSSVSSI